MPDYDKACEMLGLAYPDMPFHMVEDVVTIVMGHAVGPDDLMLRVVSTLWECANCGGHTNSVVETKDRTRCIRCLIKEEGERE